MEMSNNIPVARLSSTEGKTIPLLGLGTAEFPFGTTSPEIVRNLVLHAIKLGYRHFDTASMYQTEQPLGEAILDALRLGYIKSRDELFITSKLWASDGHRHLVLPALRKTLKKIEIKWVFKKLPFIWNLKLEYLDLYLIHFPVSQKPGVIRIPPKEDLLPMDIKSVWEAMEECQELGLTKSIGVSNFSCKKLETLLASSKILPAVNQVEMSPLWQQKKLREFCKDKGIHVSAYSPLGARGTFWGTNLVMESDVLKEIADARGKTPAQVCLRWVYEQGVSVLVKSYNKERIEENLHIFDWKLSTEDLEKINQLPQRKAYPGLEFVHDEGPYKTVEEFWDGEV